MQPKTSFAVVAGHRLECVEYPAHQLNRPPLVFLHEGLGSISMWRDFPARVARATGCRSIVYSRYGYGQSDALSEAFRPDYMHREAQESLPELLAELGVDKPVLIGHSDGASIALIHAGSRRWQVEGLVLLAPHVFVEDVSISSIAAAKLAYETTDLAQKLGRHHRDADKTFWGWNDIWLHPDFRAWNIEEYLAGISCPLLAIQGEDDEYGTLAQIDAIAAQTADTRRLLLPDCRHSPHKDQPEATLSAIVEFVDDLPA